jgi:hypothetical protein
MLRVRCPRCGLHAQLAQSEVVLRLAPGAGDSRFSFVCRFCVMVVTRVADRRTIVLLHAAGVELDDSGDGYPEVRPDGPPFTRDDLLTFHERLDSDDAFKQLDPSSDGRGGGR